MSNEKPQFDIGYLVVALIFAGVFAMAYITSQETEDPQAILLAQQKWAKNDLLLNTLQRYTDVYQKLDRAVDKEALAESYMRKITKDLTLFPAKDGASIRVVLPEQTANNTTVMVLKEISLGTNDNGLFKAFREIVDPKPLSSAYQPPLYIAEVEQLLSYVMTGHGSVEMIAGIIK